MSKTCTCGTEIFFATTKSGASLPLEREPVEPGRNRFVLIQSRSQGDPIAVPASVFTALEPDEKAVPALYIAHFGQCPDAQRFRK